MAAAAAVCEHSGAAHAVAMNALHSITGAPAVLGVVLPHRAVTAVEGPNTQRPPLVNTVVCADSRF